MIKLNNPIDECLRMLERVQIPYHIEQFLRSQYATSDKRILGLHKHFSDEFDQSLALIQNHWKNTQFQNLIGYQYSIDNIPELAEEIALYFHQGRELLELSLGKFENSSPLVEYYGFLQCIKGVALLKLDVKDRKLFVHHGLSSQSNDGEYIEAIIKNKGVFIILLLYQNSKHVVEHYVDNHLKVNLNVTLKESMEQVGYLNNVGAFITSFLLSNLVRYHPRTWNELLSGKKDDIIADINDFRRQVIPIAIKSLIQEQLPYHSQSSF